MTKAPQIKKQFKLKPHEFRELVRGIGSCLATDKITVNGLPVRYMYCETPDNDHDSGWRFLSGTEDEAYGDDPAN